MYARGKPVGAFLAALVVPAALAPSAAASGPPVLNVTERPVDNVVIHVDAHPCTGAPLLLTSTETGTIHVTRFTDGSVHFTVSLRATFAADLLPADGITDATGGYTVHGDGNGFLHTDGTAFDRAEGSFSVNGAGTNTDGSAFNFHGTAHTVFGPDGLPKLDLAHTTCH